MLTKKMKVLSEFKTPMPLLNCDRIKVLLPYEDGRVLEKTTCKVYDAENGIIELTLSDFELQGLKSGVSNFLAKLYMKDGTMYSVNFAKGLKIEIDPKTERKVWA